jgi:lysophospholipase L1-like esterase
MLRNKSTVLFQGDSITDAGRVKEDKKHLGAGYVMVISSWFSAVYPGKQVSFLNRGVGGDRVENLEARWQEDCIDLKPDIISVLVGINDTWRRYNSNDPVSPEDFRDTYEKILIKTKEKLNAKIILCEPFLLPVSKDIEKRREDLNPKIKVVRDLSRKFKATLVPLDKIFGEACSKRNPAFWAEDGVHPTLVGHALIAQSWLKAVKVIV